MLKSGAMPVQGAQVTFSREPEPHVRAKSAPEARKKV
jgi:hypothetical protein